MPPSTESQISLQVKTRERYFQRLQKCYDCIAGGESKKKEFLVRCRDIDALVEKFEGLADTINTLNLQLTDETKVVDTAQSCTAFEEIFYCIKAHEAALKEHEVPSPSPHHDSQTKVKLPVLTIPSFEGDPITFQTWKGLFDELIHHNPDLSDIEKFSYLKSFVKGPALSCVDAVSFVAANYPLAYRTLNERYYNKRIIAASHLNKILNFQPLKSESLAGLRSFLDIIHVSVESLKGLTIQNLDEFILLYLGLNVLDPNTKKLFEEENLATTFPSFGQLVAFVKGRCAILEVTSGQVPVCKSNFPKSFVTVQSDKLIKTPDKPVIQNPGKKYNKCLVCDQSFHKISSCPKFLKCEPSKRFSIVKDQKLCFSCFGGQHSSGNCSSVYRCRVCESSRHHTLLHPSEGKKSISQVETVASTSSALSGVAQGSYSVLLGTATVQIQDNIGQWHSVRCIIDPGSQISAVSENLVQNLRLPRKNCTLQISGIGSQNSIRAKGEVECTILPHRNVCSGNVKPLSICAAILPKIASDIPAKVPSAVLNKFRHLQLADITYLTSGNNVNCSIDLLLGAEYYSDLMTSNLPAIPGYPSAIPSYFGWLLMGKVCDSKPVMTQKVTSLFISSLSDPISEQIQKFWEMEGVSEEKPINPEDIFCEQHFCETHSRDSDGKYIVKLPFENHQHPLLESNRSIAFKRFKNLQVKLNKNLHMKSLYEENLNSYLDMGHMTLAENPSSYLLVHHGVYKQSSSTPLRVVFDPNVSAAKNKSLNSALMVGPKLQTDIGDLLVQFRLNTVAVLCDIKSMYRCIWVAKEDCKYQHILWQDQDQNIKEYELKTVTFGLPPSPFLAQRVIKQLVLDEGHSFPSAAKVMNTSVYVDDIVTGADSIQAACILKDELISLMCKGGFQLRKWASSHPEVLSNIPSDMCETVHSLGDTESLKVLGVQWSPNSDTFFYCVKPGDTTFLTKRKVLSVIASTYDPNGFLSPVIIWLKIFMQQIWLNKDISWDTVLPNHLQEKWCEFMSQIQDLSKIHIPRYVLGKSVRSVELVGFADGSALAYSAVVYLRVVSDDGVVQTHLIRAKTKVSPLKTITINKIELCAALLLARVIRSLSFLLKQLNIQNIYLFSDSTTVLAWLRLQPHLLNTFVANRVVEILQLTAHCSWRHVASQENSADPASRGLLPRDLINNSLWFKGPSFLKKDPQEWPQSGVQTRDIPELKLTHVSLSTQLLEASFILNLIEKNSSLGKLQRVVSYILRFIHNIRFPLEKRSGVLTLDELQQALLVCVKVSQRFYFSKDLESVERGDVCSSVLRTLSPFINESGLLAVGGRLAFAPLSEGTKHPILIPKKSPLAKLLVGHYHTVTIHGGPKIVQSLIQRNFWILGARSLIRGVLRKCTSCVRFLVRPTQPYMADLPVTRFEQGRPFINVSVDFGGPFPFKTGPRRNSPIDKCWLALFVCLATKAVHLEVVSSLSSNAFLATLDRFIGRRGYPSKIISDNGTNFRGAAAQLQNFHKMVDDSESDIVSHLQAKCIQWQFCPPGAPNFNGLAEAGIKSVKKHLRHVLGDQPLTFEEYNTLFVRVEAILNSRPLCSLHASPNEGTDYLTPGHFLVGAPLLARPEPGVSDVTFTPARRWQLISHFTQCFWKRWSSDYLNSLTQRSKWTKHCKNIQIGDIVLLQSPNVGPQNWPLGRVTQLLPGKDEHIRVVKVKTKNGEVVRPVSKLVILPTSQQ